MAGPSLLNDILFKIVFGQQSGVEPLRAMLNALLGFEGQGRIVELELLNPYGGKEHLLEKDVILDVKARDAQRRLYNIEVQMSPEPAYIERSLYYLARLFGSQLEPGEPYSQLARTIGISLVDFTLFPDTEELHSRFRLHDERNGRELTEVFELHFIELVKFRRQTPDELRTPFEKWVHLLRFSELYEGSEQPVPEVLLREEGIEMALTAMRKARASREVRELIDMREKAMHAWATRLQVAEQKGIEKGIETGVETGRRNAALEMARKMRQEGLSVETIARVTGLPLEDLKE